MGQKHRLRFIFAPNAGPPALHADLDWRTQRALVSLALSDVDGETDSLRRVHQHQGIERFVLVQLIEKIAKKALVDHLVGDENPLDAEVSRNLKTPRATGM